MAFTVTLQDCPSGNINTIAQAINRFRRELERRLGDWANAALRAYQNASDSPVEELTQAEIGLASDYAAAYDAARTAGFRELGDVQEAYFEVRLAS